MDILHATKFYYPKVGGVERVVQSICEAVSDRGGNARVVSTVGSGRGRRLVHNGVRITKASGLGVCLSVPIAPTYPFHLRSGKQSADIVHFHLPDPLSVTSQVISGPTDAQIVATYHADISRESQQRVLGLYQPILDRFLQQLDHIVVTSPRLRDRSPFLEGYRDKCTVIPLGIDMNRCATGVETDYRIPGDGNRPTILFVGRLIYYKGLEYAIDAMQGVDADLLIAGQGPQREELERRASAHELENRVHFLGFVPDEALHYYFDRADIFIFPSIANSEGFGMAQLEAMAHGRPVINTALDTGVPWVSQDGETGITVPPEDAIALTDAINKLISDIDLRGELGTNARHRVENKFTHAKMLEDYLELYDQLNSG